MFVLDTDHLTFLEQGRSVESDRLRARLAGEADRDVAVTIISFEEQTRGWLAYLARARSLPHQVAAYAKLRRMVANYHRIPMLDFDTTASVEFQRLMRSRLRIGTMDLKIAAIVLAHDATLVTRNLIDFRKVPGLHVEGWTT